MVDVSSPCVISFTRSSTGISIDAPENGHVRAPLAPEEKACGHALGLGAFLKAPDWVVDDEVDEEAPPISDLPSDM